MDAHIPYTKQQHQFWQAIISLTISSLLTFSTLYIFQPLLPVFVETYDVSTTLSSFLMSASVFTMMFGLFILGFLADRYGKKNIMIVSLTVTILTLAAMAFSTNFSFIVGLRLLQGFFLAGVPASAMGYLGNEIDRRYIGIAMTLYIASNALGGMSGRVWGGYSADKWGWETSLLSLSGFGVVALLLFIVLLPSERPSAESRSSLKSDLKGMLIHLTDRKLIPLFVMGLLLQIMFTAVWTYLPFYLKGEPFNWSLKWISYTYFAYVLGVLAPPLASRFSNRFGLFNVMLSGLMLLAIGTWLTAIHNSSVIIFGLTVLCTGFFISHSMAAALVNRTATHHKSGASSFYLINYYLGVTIGSSAVGTLWDHFAWTGILSTSMLLLFIFMFLPKLKHQS
ncbi:MFS transporter [Pseudalkalibacillus berkeleyi]|uniref:MFS transporter n=1 Tax=Pseudalkalibacillus berkeleyi TaxID=1069813 RepID=A0ABS9H3Y0_9BACL|nr:MFS transporter [Pseudalkalibacillus berkeleyi]MCF6138503.1 MFS transporter [Pseudalkalibacillus berkeleyi]